MFDGQELNLVKASKERKILSWLKHYPSNMIMFHHRMPTSTINVKRAAHPFSTKDYFGDNQYILIHNGWITNDATLHRDHNDLGIEYQSNLIDGTFNDSEALLWDVALFLEGKQDKLKAKGAIAFVCMKLHKGKLVDLFFARNTGSPLKMLKSEDGLVLSSEGEGAMIELDQLYRFDYSSHKLYKTKCEVPEYVYSYQVNKAPKNYSSTWDSNRGMGFHGLDDFSNEYEHDHKSQLYLPVAKPKFSPEEIDNFIFSYLLASDGNFDTAYFLMEADYIEKSEEFDATPFSEMLNTEVKLLEAGMARIIENPEYIDEDSTSSVWREAWNSIEQNPLPA